MENGIALVGTGFIGPVHVEALRRLGRNVVGVLASTPEKGKQAAAALQIPRGYATFADFCVSTKTWEPIIIQLTGLKAETNIGLRLLYIDFPQAMANFSALSPTQEADILAHNLAPVQSKDDFLFVYPIVQGTWDSTTRFTSSGSAYGGKSIYEVMKGLMGQYNSP